MTNKLLVSIQLSIATLVLALVLLSAGLAQASEVTGTLSSGTGGSAATGTIQGGTGNTISGTVVSPPDGVGGGGDNSGGGGSSHRSSSNNNNNDGEVLGAQTEPDGVGGGFGVPGIPNTGVGGGALFYLASLMLALGFAVVGYIATTRRFKL